MTKSPRRTVVPFLLLAAALTAESYSPSHRVLSSSPAPTTIAATASTSTSTSTTTTTTTTSRREALRRAGLATFLGCGAAALQPRAAVAAGGVPDEKELQKLQVGYSRVQYLLSNWDYVTSKCGSSLGAGAGSESKQVVRTDGGGGGACERDPIRVQEFIGYRSMNDPLFKADKLMMRALPLVADDKVEAYQEAMEKFREKADDAAGLAFTSSWGEANPGGGKDVVDAYLERTKVYVVDVESSLKAVLKCLDLKELPPLTGKL